MATSRKPTRAPCLSESELCAWAAEAEPGAVLEYHCGFLAVDRTTVGRRGDTAARAALDGLAERAHDLAVRGLVNLVQRLRGPGDYSYLAVARPCPGATRDSSSPDHQGGPRVNAPANRPRIGDIRTMPVGEIAALPAEVLALLQDEAEEAIKATRALSERLGSAIALRYGDRAAALRHQAGKDTGTVRLVDGAVTVIAELPKKIAWDQAHLAALVERIRAGGEDPAEYVSTELKVSERAFTAWPESIRQLFAAARTVRTGKASFRLILGDEETTQ